MMIRNLTSPIHGRRGLRSWTVIALLACLIAPISESVHGVLLENFHVPYPYTPGIPRAMLVVGLAVRLMAVAIFVRMLLPHRWRAHPIASAVYGCLLIMMLNETGRVVIIESAIVQSLPAAMLHALPKLLTGVEAALVIPVATTHIRWSALLACVLTVSLSFVLYLSPWLDDQVAAWSTKYFPKIAEHYSRPYPAFVQFRILAGFLEPTIAVFVLLFLCWGSLRGSTWKRMGWFTLFLLVLMGRVVSLCVFAFWVKQPFPWNFLAESQFFFESATLAVLCSLAWAWFGPPPGDLEPSRPDIGRVAAG